MNAAAVEPLLTRGELVFLLLVLMSVLALVALVAYVGEDPTDDL